MMQRLARIARIRRDENGSMAIETAFVTPMLLMLALGGFEASTMVARQTELQTAAAEAATVVRAVQPDDDAERATVRGIVATSICENYEVKTEGTTSTCGEEGEMDVTVTVTPLVRCGTAADYSEDGTDCGSEVKYEFIQIDLTDRYDPIWTKWGVSDGFDFNVSRTVQVG